MTQSCPTGYQEASYRVYEKAILALRAETWKAALLEALGVACKDVKARVAHMIMPFYEQPPRNGKAETGESHVLHCVVGQLGYRIMELSFL